MEKLDNDKKKVTYRWLVPLLVTVPFVIWEIAAFGFAEYALFKSAGSFIVISLFYNWLLDWIKDKPGEIPSALKLILYIPLFAAFMLLVLPPFPYVRPWFVTIITSVLGFEFWAFGIGYLIQETKLQNICTERTVAMVLDNITERIDTRPGEVSTSTFYPVLTYTVNGVRLQHQYEHGQPRPMEVDRQVEICYNPYKPEEICFLNQKENKALIIGVSFALLAGTASLIAAVFSVVLK